MSVQSIGILAAVLLLFPLLVVVLGEVVLRLRSRGLAYAASVSTIRNVILPLIAFYLLLVYVARVPPDALVSKLFVTFSIIIGLVALIGVINGVLFERETGSRVPKLFLDLGRILVVALGIAMTMSLVWGQDLSQLITALGVSSIVLGLALQDTLGNLFSGITLINEQPFQVGDYIEVDGLSGKVVEVNWRAVRLLTRERDLIVLPHLKVAQSPILNHSRPEEHWAEKLTVGFSYDHPPNQVKRVLYETCLATPHILHDPPPEVKVDDFADSAVTYEVEYYVPNYGAREEIRDDFMSRVWYAARRSGFTIPFPQLNIHREPQTQRARADEAARERHVTFAVRLLGVAGEREDLLNNPRVEILDFGEGETLLDQGSNRPGLFLLLSGEVRLIHEAADGTRVSLAELHRGDLVTELLQTGSRTNAITVLAIQDTEAVFIGEQTLRRLVNRYPKLAFTVEEMLVTRRKQIGKMTAG